MARKKIIASTDNSKWEAPKVRKPRKPMPDKHRAAAAERLAKAREARAKKNPNYGKSGLHESLHDLPDEHELSPTKVKQWIKIQQDYAKSERAAVRQNVKGAVARLASHEGYIRNMQKYLRDGDWVDMFYGEQMQRKIRNRCVALSYYWFGPKKGEPKRDVGTFYPDMGCVYTQEMLEEEREDERPAKPAGKRNQRTVARKKRKRSKRS